MNTEIEESKVYEQPKSDLRSGEVGADNVAKYVRWSDCRVSVKSIAKRFVSDEYGIDFDAHQDDLGLPPEDWYSVIAKVKSLLFNHENCKFCENRNGDEAFRWVSNEERKAKQRLQSALKECFETAIESVRKSNANLVNADSDTYILEAEFNGFCFKISFRANEDSRSIGMTFFGFEDDYYRIEPKPAPSNLGKAIEVFTQSRNRLEDLSTPAGRPEPEGLTG